MHINLLRKIISISFRIIINYFIWKNIKIKKVNNSDDQDIINDNNESIVKFNRILFDDSNEEKINNQHIKASQKDSVHQHKCFFNINDLNRKNNNKNINNNNNPSNNNGNQMKLGNNQNFKSQYLK